MVKFDIPAIQSVTIDGGLWLVGIRLAGVRVLGFKGAMSVLAGLSLRGALLVVVALETTRRVGVKGDFSLAFFSCSWTAILCADFEMERVGTVTGGPVESGDEDT